MGTVTVATLVLALSTCVSEANATTASALAIYQRGAFADAAHRQWQAALNLAACLEKRPHEANTSSEQRLGELWMYAGEYAYRAGNTHEASRFLTLAKRIFSQLRSSGTLHGRSLDEVLLDAHEVDGDLRKVPSDHSRG